jgi:hypothetical protein
MKRTFVYRFRLIYTALLYAVISLCLQIPSAAARETPPSTSEPITIIAAAPCRTVIVTVSQISFGAFMEIKLQNTSATTSAFLTGFTFQWLEPASYTIRLKQVTTFEPIGTIWMNSRSEVPSLITGNSQSHDWQQTVEIPPNSASSVFFVFDDQIDMFTRFFGSLTLSCDPDDTGRLSAVFGTPPHPSLSPNGHSGDHKMGSAVGL